MAVEASLAGTRGLLFDLVRDGARAAAPEPGVLTGALNESGTDIRAGEDMVSRVGWYVGAAPVILRLLVLPAATLVLVGVYGVLPLLSLVCVVALVSLADLLALRRAARHRGLESQLLPVGLALGLVANLTVAATVPASLFAFAAAVTGAYVVATVILWTLAWGGLAGLVPVAANVPLQATMVWLNHVHDPAGVPHALAYAAAGTVGLGLAMGTALIALTVLGFGTRLAMTVGMHAGREAERATILRGMDDTVLQTLEAIALQPVESSDDPEQTLSRLRGMARGEAIQIRRALDELTGQHPQARQLADDLVLLAGEMAGSGLGVQLALGQIDDSALTATRRAALRDATREALHNAAKHSGAPDAVVHLDESEHGVTVIVRDHGRGFDVRAPLSGFGVRQSIPERMADAGGRAHVWSRPGLGTRVTLWAPLTDPVAGG